MPNQKILRLLNSLKTLEPGPVGSIPSPVPLELHKIEQPADIKLQEVPISDVLVPRTSEPTSVEEGPLSENNLVEARKAALERLKQRPNQKLDFTGQ